MCNVDCLSLVMRSIRFVHTRIKALKYLQCHTALHFLSDSLSQNTQPLSRKRFLSNTFSRGDNRNFKN